MCLVWFDQRLVRNVGKREMLHAPVSNLTQNFCLDWVLTQVGDDDTQEPIFYFLIRSISSHSDHYNFQVGQMMSCRKKGKIENKIYFYFPPRRLIRFTNDNIDWQGLYANIGSPVTASQPRACLSSIITLSVILPDECWHCIEWVNSAPDHLISYPLCTLPLVRSWSSLDLLVKKSRSDEEEEEGGLGGVTDIKLSSLAVSKVWGGVSVSSFWMSVSKCWLKTSSLAPLASLNVSCTLVWMVIICLDSDTEEEEHSPVCRPPGL